MNPAPLGCLALLALSPAHLATQDEPLGAGRLVEEGWLRVPAYTGEHRACLPDELVRETTAAAHLFAAATELAPDHLRAFWSLGHAHVLLAETARQRGRAEEADEHFDAADRALTRAIELDPTDPWAWYARGAARAGTPRLGAAYEDLCEATERSAERMKDTGPDGNDAWLRFKSLEWRPEVLMRSGDFEEARAELTAFHGEFSNNSFPLEIALAESYERERDFEGARAAYERITQAFPEDHQAYALLGYLAGLRGDHERATAWLQEAIRRELQPGLYTRLWLWILATGETRSEAEADLRTFLEFPPPALTAWDVDLGRFLLGEGTPDAFLERAREELERRIEAGENLDDLMCESWFYAGLRHESAAASAGDAAVEHRRAALEAHERALADRPLRWKWEWAFARLRYAALAESLGLEAESSFRVDGRALDLADGGVRQLASARWHPVGATGPRTELGRDPRPGDLLLARQPRGADAGPRLVLLLVHAAR